MPLYNCELCNYNTHILTHYNKHIITKKHIKRVEEIGGIEKELNSNEIMNTNEHEMNTNEHEMNTNDPSEFQCIYCFQDFNTKPSLRRHQLHYCKWNIDYKALYKKEKKEWKKESFKVRLEAEKEKELIRKEWMKDIKKMNSELGKIRNEWQDEKKDLYKKIEKLIDKAGDTTNNNIILNNYGKEDLEHIDYKYISNIFKEYKAPGQMIIKVIKDVHFNDQVPENKNIQYPNKKENKVKVFKEGKWLYEDKNDAINDLVDSKYIIIDTHYDEYREELNNIAQYKYDKFRFGYDNDNEQILNNLRKDCEYLLLNNRD